MLLLTPPFTVSSYSILTLYSNTPFLQTSSNTDSSNALLLTYPKHSILLSYIVTSISVLLVVVSGLSVFVLTIIVVVTVVLGIALYVNRKVC